VLLLHWIAAMHLTTAPCLLLQVKESKPYVKQYGEQRLPKYMQVGGSTTEPTCYSKCSGRADADERPSSHCCTCLCTLSQLQLKQSI
jgi:hypothetical protein